MHNCRCPSGCVLLCRPSVAARGSLRQARTGPVGPAGYLARLNAPAHNDERLQLYADATPKAPKTPPSPLFQPSRCSEWLRSSTYRPCSARAIFVPGSVWAVWQIGLPVRRATAHRLRSRHDDAETPHSFSHASIRLPSCERLQAERASHTIA